MEKQNINDDIMSLEMCAQAFGNTSSPSCSNYTLRCTVVGNEEQFGREV